ncbi:MAG: hypothetical protein V7K43_30720 [Nostoc sp.]
MNRGEIKGIFGLSDLKQTQVYQEGKQEGAREEKFKMIPSFFVEIGIEF